MQEDFKLEPDDLISVLYSLKITNNITKQRKDTVMCAFFLSNDVLWILNKLSAAGYRADIVGGPVRDLLRGVEPSDFDITTSALPKETETVFSGERIIETGIKHGTVALIKNGVQYEITTYRIDGEYSDSRHPSSVSFTKSIEEDLARRDFTINAIAYSHQNGLTDPYGGAEDIKRGIIKAVGVAEDRFDEDALRILRGVRFASTLGFEIEEQTSLAMVKKAHLLDKISKERIFTEWKKLLLGKNAIKIISENQNVIHAILPDVSIPKSLCTAAWDSARFDARHIALLTSLTPEKYISRMRSMKTDRHIIELGASVLASIGKYGSSAQDLAFMLRDIGEESAECLIECESILNRRSASDLKLLSAVKNSGVPYKLSMLNIDGNALLDMGFSGIKIKKTLLYLQEKIILGELNNDSYSLKKAASVRLD